MVRSLFIFVPPFLCSDCKLPQITTIYSIWEVLIHFSKMQLLVPVHHLSHHFYCFSGSLTCIYVMFDKFFIVNMKNNHQSKSV